MSGRGTFGLLAGRLMVVFATVLLLGALTASTAGAAPGDRLPTASLNEVVPGQICEARTVMRGTSIHSFEVKILEVSGFGDLAHGRLIYFEVTDPAVRDVGVAGGMSGSPILCDFGGTEKVIGAISYGFDGVGPRGFATPINDVLNGQPFAGDQPARERGRRLSFRGGRLIELKAPLVVTGVPMAARGAVQKDLKRRGAGEVTFASEPDAEVLPGDPDLAPGGAFAMNYSYGDISIGAICTITYRDGDRFWGCGHPIDLAGQRNLSISGAYIYDVLGSAWGSSSKFGAPTAPQVGAMLYDGPYAVSGRLNQAAPTLPVKFELKSEAGTTTLESNVVAEHDLPGGWPQGFSYTAPVATMMAVKAQFQAAGQPTVQHGSMRISQRIIGSGQTVNGSTRFASSLPSWAYDPDWGTFTGAAWPVALATDAIASLVDSARYRKLTPGALDVAVDIRTGPGLRQIIDLKPLGRVRAGKLARFRVISADPAGKRYLRTVRVRIPRKAVPPGKAQGTGMFKVRSSAVFGQEDGSTYLALDRDAKAWGGYIGGWEGPPPINSVAQLGRAIRGMFSEKAKLELKVPNRKRPLALALKNGNTVPVGSAVRKVTVKAPVRSAGRK